MTTKNAVIEMPEPWQITEHFTIEDIRCPCCNMLKIIPAMYRHMEMLEILYAIIAFEITSGYRCKFHNKAVGGSDGSWHQLFATDIKALEQVHFEHRSAQKNAEILAGHAESVGFKGGIGIYTDGHVHLDTRLKLTRWRG